MLNKLTLKNFKLFKEETEVPLSNLNLLTGINGRGKSTVLQSLLLMKQSPGYDRSTNKIIFNGDDVKLGSFNDIKNINTQPSENIELRFYYDEFSVQYNLSRASSDLLGADINMILVEGGFDNHSFKHRIIKEDESYIVYKDIDNESLDPFPIILHDLFISDISLALYYENRNCELVKEEINFTKIHYVSADRLGPQLYYKEQSLKEFYSVGALGEDTVNVLYHSQQDIVHERFIKNIGKFFPVDSDELGLTVELQTQFWPDKLFDGAKYRITPVEAANLLTLEISSDGTFNYYKTTNVGYGFTYVLPIIVAGLIAKPGEIFIVENPEAHLHPYAQSIIARFLTLVSLKGVQVIIESHSEHILNGLRIPIYDKIISNEHLNVLYFDRSSGSHFNKIRIDVEGGVEDWPSNFFDQTSKDLDHLLGI